MLRLVQYYSGPWAWDIGLIFLNPVRYRDTAVLYNVMGSDIQAAEACGTVRSAKTYERW